MEELAKKEHVEIIEYFNKQNGMNFRLNNLHTQRLIYTRIKEGFTVEDFKKVIDFKIKEWGNNKKMKIYIRPMTLFSTKFESYLQQALLEEKEKENDEENKGDWF